MVDASTPTRALPDSNEAGLDLVAGHVSAAKVEAFRRLGLRIVQGRRQGVRIWDLDGKAYLNCRSSGGVFDFGHRPEFAIRALTRALQELGDMGDWLVPSAVRAQGAAALASTLPGDLRYTFFTPGGGEAVEVACKLARATTGRTGIVAAEHGYHGHVGFALAMDEARDSQWFAPLVPGITKVPFGDVAAVARAVTDETAAVCMETVPATAGYLVPPADYWPSVRELCDERGVLLILDEVQSGLGRTGRIWACERWGVAPDLLVAGKGLSGGVYPIAACSFGDRVDAFFARDPFFHPSSYGGSELGAAVVEAVIGKVTEPGFLDHVNEMGARLAAGFDHLCAAHPGLLVGHHGLGLMRALDTVSPEDCYRFMLEAIDGGLLVVWANNKQDTLLVMPPLVVEADEIDEILHILDGAATRAGAP
ncbi:MAG TPA: aminotransferase class III-fold pyridoxal phosphate-dependent enzyme [Acidimicrobiales bacterium]|nr:aminotransferase class III-fold pyridoxal phosphate-dependent enzyme [Acidimicrobiales bacterium]